MTQDEYEAWCTEINFATTSEALVGIQVALMRPEAPPNFELRMKLWHYAHRKLGAIYSNIKDGAPRVFRKKWVAHDP